MVNDIFLQVIKMTVVSSVIILCVILARLILKKAPKVFSYVLWMVVLFRLLCPFAIQVPVNIGESAGIKFNQMTSREDVITRIESLEAADDISNVATNSTISLYGGFTTAVLVVWGCGVGIMLMYGGIMYLQLRKKLVGTFLLRNNIYLTDYIDTPFVLGILHPQIYIPSALSEQEMKYIIVHEQQHIHRLDHIVKMFACLALCIHWFNPLVWLAFVLICNDMEMSCDEAVLRKLGDGIRADYAAALLNIATGNNKISAALAFGGGDVKERIRNMKNWKSPKKYVIVLATLFCLSVSTAFAAEPVRKDTIQPSKQDTLICRKKFCIDSTHIHETVDCEVQEAEAKADHDSGDYCTDTSCIDYSHDHHSVTDNTEKSEAVCKNTENITSIGHHKEEHHRENHHK